MAEPSFEIQLFAKRIQFEIQLMNTKILTLCLGLLLVANVQSLKLTPTHGVDWYMATYDWGQYNRTYPDATPNFTNGNWTNETGYWSNGTDTWSNETGYSHITNETGDDAYSVPYNFTAPGSNWTNETGYWTNGTDTWNNETGYSRETNDYHAAYDLPSNFTSPGSNWTNETGYWTNGTDTWNNETGYNHEISEAHAAYDIPNNFTTPGSNWTNETGYWTNGTSTWNNETGYGGANETNQTANNGSGTEYYYHASSVPKHLDSDKEDGETQGDVQATEKESQEENDSNQHLRGRHSAYHKTLDQSDSSAAGTSNH